MPIDNRLGIDPMEMMPSPLRVAAAATTTTVVVLIIIILVIITHVCVL